MIYCNLDQNLANVAPPPTAFMEPPVHSWCWMRFNFNSPAILNILGKNIPPPELDAITKKLENQNKTSVPKSRFY